jgi:hypothetical protein
MTKEEHIKLLREADERVLPRRKNEADEAYGRRMHEHLNGSPVSRA